MISGLRTVGLCVGLLAAVYVPTFAIVSALKKPLDAAVPIIIGISALIALALIVALNAKARYTFREFGFRWPDRKTVGWAILGGIPAALIVSWLDRRFGSQGPLAGLSLPLFTAFLYFGVCAPMQEELIFRGLIQTVAARNWIGNVGAAGVRVSGAVVVAALLFGLVHLELNVFTAVSAFGLGVLTGELRRRSGSVVPAVIVHALFNSASFLWMAP